MSSLSNAIIWVSLFALFGFCCHTCAQSDENRANREVCRTTGNLCDKVK